MQVTDIDTFWTAPVVLLWESPVLRLEQDPDTQYIGSAVADATPFPRALAVQNTLEYVFEKLKSYFPVETKETLDR